VPSLPNNVPVPEDSNSLGVSVDQFARFGQVNKAAYTLVFFHTALIQAVLSGFIGGQIGEGSLKDGAKHAAAMLGMAYLAFVLLTSPVAQITFSDQALGGGDTVVVDSVSLSEGGYVTIRAQDPSGEVVGRTDYLVAGQYTDVRIELDSVDGEEMELYALPHLDTDGDERFGYTGGGTDPPYPSDQTAVYDQATVLLEEPSLSPPGSDRPATSLVRPATPLV
jgi:flagellar protein FlaJ